MLRLAFVIPTLEPGGAELQMLALAERLPAHGFTVEFVATTGPGRYDDRARQLGARVHALEPIGSDEVRGLARQRARFVRLARFLQLLRAGRYDIVDAWLYPTDVMVALGRFLTATPIVLSGRLNIHERDRFGRLSETVDRVANRLTTAVVANGEAVATNAVERQGVDPGRIHIIRNGVALPVPLSADRRARVRSALGASEDEVLIGCVGNYREVKRHALLIDSFADLLADGAQARLVLVGEGPMRTHIQRQVAALGLGSRIRVHGSAHDPGPLYDAFDVVVQASRSEGLPNVLLEAGAAGRAIVATAAGSTYEAVIDGQTGLIVPVEDRGALAAALRRLVEDAGLRERLGAAGREHVGRVFGMERFVDEWAALYRRLADERGRA